MPIVVKCGYCGQMTKSENCGYYKGIFVHNKPDCNCLQNAINSNFSVVPDDIGKKRY